MAASGVGAYESGGNLDTINSKLGNLGGISVMNVTAVTTTQTSADQSVAGCRGAYIIVNVTTLTGTSPTLTPTIQGKGPVATVYFALLVATTVISATGAKVYYIYPNAPAAAQGITQSAPFSLPFSWNVVMTAGGTITNATYTVEASYVL